MRTFKPLIDALSTFERRLDQKPDLWLRLEQNVLEDWFQRLWGTQGFGGWEHTLYDTGALFRSFTDTGDPENIADVYFDTLSYGSALHYARYWETEIIGRTENDQRFEGLIVAEIERWLDDVVKETF